MLTLDPLSCIGTVTARANILQKLFMDQKFVLISDYQFNL